MQMQHLFKDSALKRCVAELINDGPLQLATLASAAGAVLLSSSFIQQLPPTAVERHLVSAYATIKSSASNYQRQWQSMTSMPATPWLHPELLQTQQTQSAVTSKHKFAQMERSDKINSLFLIDITNNDFVFARRYRGEQTAPSLSAYNALPLLSAAVNPMHFGVNTLDKFAHDKPVSDRLTNSESFTVILDPGHGGSDPGAVSHNGLQEKALTLEIAAKVANILDKQQGINVILTRNSDEGMSRQERLNRVTRNQGDLVVSLHLNHLPQTELNLVETYFAGPKNIVESLQKRMAESATGMIKISSQADRRLSHSTAGVDLSFTKGSKKIASLLQERVFNTVKQSNPNTKNAGVKQDTLYMLTRSFTPGVLIEISCLSNEHEANLLSDENYLQRIAAALANGITDFAKQSNAPANNDIEA